MSMMEHLVHFAPLAERYDGFILDLWGVIHDGVTPYPGAVDCLAHLKRLGKRTVLLSNAPRRAHVAQAAMRGMGIADDMYTGILTSGEATHSMLRNRLDPFFADLGTRIYHLGPERDRNVFETLPLTLVACPKDADFVLNTGPDDLGSSTDLEAWEHVLTACLSAGLPMVCANPDLEVIRGGSRLVCAGLLTQRYEELGGTARWIGKPDSSIYGPVIEMLSVPKPRILAVGDALRTDIAGATSVGLASCWILGGIHAEEVGSDPVKIDAAAAAAGLSPVACLPAFVW